MPVPTQELKLQIVHAATAKTLGAKAAPGADGALVVRDFPDGGPSPEQWHLTPVQAAQSAQGGQAQDDQAYVIRNAVSGKVLDDPAAADRSVRQRDAATGQKSQDWHLVPVEGEAGLYVIEGVSDGAVLDLADPADPDKDETGLVLNVRRQRREPALAPRPGRTRTHQRPRPALLTSEPLERPPVLAAGPRGRAAARPRCDALLQRHAAGPQAVRERAGRRRVGERRSYPLARRATGCVGRAR
jgi:hypothetical protein